MRVILMLPEPRYAAGTSMSLARIRTCDTNSTAGRWGVSGLPAGFFSPNASRGTKVKVQAKYIAGWAQPFPGLGDILVSMGKETAALLI